MAQVYVKYNPYRMDTKIFVNGNEISDDNLLQYVKGKRLQEWVGGFPEQLTQALNSASFELEFHGTALDYDDFKEAFQRAEQDGIIRSADVRFQEGKPGDDISQKVVNVFTKLQEGPMDEFRTPQLKKAFENISSTVFPIQVIGTMSAGKSTLINALLGRKLMPSKNQACTDKITEILDNDSEQFRAWVQDADGNTIEEYPDLTYDIMRQLNDNNTGKVRKVLVEGNIPFLTSEDTALKLIDTPGTNNAQNQEHKNTTYRALESSSNSLVIYILNTQTLQTNDDDNLLRYVAEQIRKGGKQVRDRFLFVVNKIDELDPDEGETPEQTLRSVRRYLAERGIQDPQIFPCSALSALTLETILKGTQFDRLGDSEKKISPAVRKTIPILEMLNEEECMHLEKYSTLCPSAQNELEYRLQQAEDEGDVNEQALIHSGICSLEAAITAYVKKYAKTKKIKDLVETFEEILDSTQILVKAKMTVAQDEEAAKACAQRAATVRAKIDGGEEAKTFKQKVASIDPVKKIEGVALGKKAQIVTKVGRTFEPYGKTITNKAVAQELVQRFTNESTDLIAQMTADIEALIDKEVVGVGTELLKQYQEKLLKIDESASDQNEQLDFSTVDLIKGALSGLRESVSTQNTASYAAETVDNYGKTTHETREWYEKVGEEEEQVFDHNEQVKVGTQKVKSGSHQEKVGTRTVKNTDKKWFKPWTWFDPAYYEKGVYEMVDDYKDVDQYETKAVFKTVMRDIFEKRSEQVEKYEVRVSDIQGGLMQKLTESLDDGIADAIEYAAAQVQQTKEQFAKMFDKLDVLIKEKYQELEEAADKQHASEEILKKNRELMNWLEECKAEIDDALNI